MQFILYLSDVLVARVVQAGDHLKDLRYASGVGKLDHDGVIALRIEILAEVGQGILSETVLEYLLEVELGTDTVLAELPHPLLLVPGPVIVGAPDASLEVKVPRHPLPSPTQGHEGTKYVTIL